MIENTLRTCLHGLGSKLIFMSRSLVLDASPAIDWAVGPECPYGHREVFPDGVPGMTITDSPVGNRIGCLWKPPVDESKLGDAYRKLFAAMNLPNPLQCELGVMFRGHFWDGQTLDEFAPAIAQAVNETTGPIATVCDSQRASVIESIGTRAIAQESAEMTHDTDRHVSSVRDYLAEWWRLLNCRRIVTNCPKSSIIHAHKFINPPPPCSITT